MTQATHGGEANLYTAKTHTVGGRERGTARSSDGNLDIKLAIPGSERTGSNPEQLLAAGWSAACLEGAIARVARSKKISLPSGPEIDAEIDLNLADDGLFLRARLNVRLDGVDAKAAEAIVEQAHLTCPFSKALRGNVDVEIKLTP
ncbi:MULTISPECIES: Ohr family peroxiredoxin [unclassified Rhizobium]|nr:MULTISPECIES: Ohr family peroxiredoxin [unclassified Rhizobium]MBB3541753.1 Ohr subfamily peroxiredoxin [Rhizobium sp. BK399]MCS3740667.1 Ohr subfamily peroxiredoxin [Rhizobium sp. BK661]MCS4092497.1 Ohr subfamily peroxiredoxin [Rhizobium sp. BK176]